jgi:hypothetical protein
LQHTHRLLHVLLLLQRPTPEQPFIAGLLDPACNSKVLGEGVQLCIMQAHKFTSACSARCYHQHNTVAHCLTVLVASAQQHTQAGLQ